MVTSGVPVHPFRVWHALRTHHPKPPPRPPTTHPPIERTITMKILYEQEFLRETFEKVEIFREGHFARKGFLKRFREKTLTLLVRTLWPFNGFEEWIDWLILQIRWIKIDGFESCDWPNISQKKIDIPKFFISPRSLFIISRTRAHTHKSLEYGVYSIYIYV